MALLVEQLSRDALPQRIVVGPERTRIVVRPGDTFRFVDEAGRPPKLPDLKVRRLDNNLLVDGLPDGAVVELNNFFGACRPGAECRVELDGLGPAAGTVVTEETAPVAALADGSFLLYAPSPATASAAALPTAAGTAEAGTSSAGIWAAVGGGLLLAGAAAAAGGGGGGNDGDGGGGVDTTPPPAPVVTSAPVLKGTRPVIEGEAEAGARITLRIDVNGNGTFTDPQDAAWTTVAGADGRWTVDTATAPQSGSLPAAGLAEGTPYQVLVQATDAALNVSPATRTTVSVDATPPPTPLINVVAGDDTINAAERAQGVTVTGTAEAGSTVAVTLGTATVNAVAGAGGAWAAAFAPAQIPAGGVETIRAVATDVAGNVTPAGNAATRTVVIATDVPGAPIITDNAPTVASGPVTFTLTFDKPVTGVTADDIAITGGTKGAFTAVSASVYTLVVTPTAGVQSGQIIVQVPAGAGVDAAGNPSLAASPVIQAFDTLAPTLVVTEDAPATATGPVTFTFTFSEPVTGFTAADVAVTGAPAGALTGSGTTYQMVVTPPAVASGSIAVDVAAAAAIDAVGLPNAALAAPVVVPFDTAPPTVVITDNAPGTANGAVTYTFTFSEPVNGFEVSDLTITGIPGGTVGPLTAVSPSVYTLVVTPAVNTSGTIGLTLAAGAVTDAAANANVAAVAAAPQPFNTDLTIPSLTITDNVPAAVTNTPVTFTFAWSEPVIGFALSDITVTGGTMGAFAGSGASYTLVVNPTVNAAGTVTVTVPAASITDLNGNPNTAGATASQPFDTQAPTLTVTDSFAGATTSAPVTFTFTWSEPVTGFELADIAVAGGTAGALTGSGASYTLVVTPTASATGTMSVTVGAGAVADAAGNANTLGGVGSQVFDTVAPTLSIADNAAGTATGPVTYTFTFSEPVSGFDATDVTVTGGTKGTFTAVSTSVYTLVVTPPANATGSIDVSVAAGAATDTAGNPAGGATAASQPFNTDTTAPTLAITDNTAGTAAGPVTYTFTFSEPVTGFDATDVTVTGGTKGTFTAVSTSVYTLVVTPPANATGSIDVSVAAGAATDTAGNPAGGATAASQPFNTDTTAPTLAITDNTAGTAAGPVTFTFTWSEPVTGFELADIAVAGGTAGALTGSGTSYTLVVTPTANQTGTMSVTVGAGVVIDAAGNANSLGGAGSQPFDTRPTVLASNLLDNTPDPGAETSVAPGGTTDDPTPRFTLLLSAVLGAGSIVLSRDGTPVPATIGTNSLDWQEPTALAPGPHSYSATISDALGNSRVLDLTPLAAGDTYTFTVIP